MIEQYDINSTMTYTLLVNNINYGLKNSGLIALRAEIEILGHWGDANSQGFSPET